MNRSHWRKFVAVAVVLLLGSAAGVLAQEETGNVFAKVMDTSGNTLPGVTCELSGMGAPQIRVTNAAGEARWLSLDPGNWALKCSLEGFSTVEYPAINVRVARSVSVQVQLSEAIGEVITVTSESPLLDERKVQSGTTVSQVELEKIPTARDPWAILSQTPGVMVDRINVGGAESGQQSTFVGPGVSDDENTFLIDGVEVTDMAAVGASPTYFDFDQYTEMQFETGGSDVTKVAAGVSVNLVTKRGTNEFRGSARFLRTDDNMFDVFTQTVPVYTSGDPDLADNQSGFVGNSINQVTEYGFEAGGPVLRDRLWFWGSFGTNDIRNRTGGATPDQVQSDDTVLENTALKVNAQLSSANSAVGSWNNGNKLKFGRNASPTRPQPTTWDQRGPTAIIKFEDTHVFSSNFFLGGSYSKVDGGFGLTSKACIAAGSCEAAPETAWGADGVWQRSFLTGSSARPSEEWKLDGSYFFNTGNASHELKFGARQREFTTQSPFHWPGRDIFTVDLGLFGVGGDLMYVVAHRGETPLISQDYTSVWLQDTIQTGNWTINAGFRYDLQEGFNEPFTIPANPAFPAELPALSTTGIDPGFDWEDISPRVGVTYALGEERKTLLRASFSTFTEQLSTANINDVNPLADSYAYFVYDDVNQNLRYDAGVDVYQFLDYTTNAVLFSTEAVTPNLIDPNLSSPVTQEIILGAEHAFLPEFVAGVNLTFRNTDDLISDDRDIFTDPNTGLDRVSTAADWIVVETHSGALPGGASYTNVPVYGIFCGSGCRTGGFLQENTDREVEYQGGNIYFTKRLSNQWMLRGYLNYGDAEWKLGSAYRANYDPTDEEGGFDNDGGLFATQAAGSGAKQDVFLQSTWQWNLNGMYQVAPDRPWGFNVAANLFGREGTPLPYYNRQGRSGGATIDVQVTNEVDDFRTDDILTVDLRLEKEFAATGNVGFTVSVDAFNLFDDDYVLQRRRQTNTSQFDWLTETLSPRIWRLGVRLNWR